MKASNQAVFTSNIQKNIPSSYFATREGIILSTDHIEVLDAIKTYYKHHEPYNINLRNLNDALEEKFHHKGGMKYLYKLFPDGPVSQGCKIARLTPPVGAIDKGFGSTA